MNPGFKLSVYEGGGFENVTNFRVVSVGDPRDGVITLGGYHTANSTEKKASMEISFTDALLLIETLKEATNKMPCPHCNRKF